MGVGGGGWQSGWGGWGVLWVRWWGGVGQGCLRGVSMCHSIDRLWKVCLLHYNLFLND